MIVVDELDRCRPDYALALLEIIKHFFAVPHVHFVLGVNLRELENSVKARYGGGINAGLYLQKFVTLTMGLPARSQEGTFQIIKYLRDCAAVMQIGKEITDDAALTIACYRNKNDLSLRDIKRFMTVLALLPDGDAPLETQLGAFRLVTISLSLMKAIKLREYEVFKDGTYDIETIERHFYLNKKREEDADHQSWVLNRAWSRFLRPETVDDDRGWRNFEPTFRMRDPKAALTSQITKYLETFRVFEIEP